MTDDIDIEAEAREVIEKVRKADRPLNLVAEYAAWGRSLVRRAAAAKAEEALAEVRKYLIVPAPDPAKASDRDYWGNAMVKEIDEALSALLPDAQEKGCDAL